MSKTDRQAGASQILREKGYLIVQDEQGIWHVPGRREAGVEYVLPPQADSCSCPDHAYRQATCSHMIAITRLKSERQMQAMAVRRRKETLGYKEVS
jgi:hypothetical protein